MSTMLEELWYGHIRPWEQYPEDNADIKKLLDRLGESREKLCSSMTDEEKAMLEAYDTCLNEITSLVEREVFVRAFRLGGRIMLETVVDEKSAE